VFSIRPDNIIKRKRDRITRSSCESQETKTKMASIYCRPIRLGLYVFSTLNFFKNHTLKLIARSINYLRYAQRIFVNMYTRVMNIFSHDHIDRPSDDIDLEVNTSSSLLSNANSSMMSDYHHYFRAIDLDNLWFNVMDEIIAVGDAKHDKFWSDLALNLILVQRAQLNHAVIVTQQRWRNKRAALHEERIDFTIRQRTLHAASRKIWNWWATIRNRLDERNLHMHNIAVICLTAKIVCRLLQQTVNSR